MTVHQRISDILDAKQSKKWKLAALASLVADDRRDSLYYLLGLQKSEGSKWLKPPEIELEKRDQEEHEEAQI